MKAAAALRTGVKVVVIAAMMLLVTGGQASAGGWSWAGEFPFQVRDIAFDGNGNLTAVGVEYEEGPGFENGRYSVWAATREAGNGKSWQPMRLANLPDPAPAAPQPPSTLELEMNSKGEAVVAWVDRETISYVTRSAGGVWSPMAADVSTTMFGAPISLALGEDGTATIVYVDDGASLRSSSLPRGGAWSPFEFVSGPVASVTAHNLHRNENGDLAVAWFEYNEGPGGLIKVRKRLAGQGWGDIATVPIDEQGYDYAPSVVIDKQGAVTVICPGSEIFAATLSANGSWGTGVTSLGQANSEPRLVIDGEGRATVMWVGFDAKSVFARSRPAGGGWSSAEPLATAPDSSGHSLADPWLGVAADDNIVAFWLRQAGSTLKYESRMLPKGGSWTPPAEHTPILAPEDQSTVGAIDAEGHVMAAWRTGPEPGASSSSAVADWVPPKISDVVIPSNAVQEKLATFSVNAVDRWSPVIIRWYFPNGDDLHGSPAYYGFLSAGTQAVNLRVTDYFENATLANGTVSVAAGPTAEQCVEAKKSNRSLRAKVKRTNTRIKRLNRQIRKAKRIPRKRKLRTARTKARRTLAKQKKALRRGTASEKRLCEGKP